MDSCWYPHTNCRESYCAVNRGHPNYACGLEAKHGDGAMEDYDDDPWAGEALYEFVDWESWD